MKKKASNCTYKDKPEQRSGLLQLIREMKIREGKTLYEISADIGEGITPAIILDIISGRSKEIKLSQVQTLAKFFKFSLDDMASILIRDCDRTGKDLTLWQIREKRLSRHTKEIEAEYKQKIEELKNTGGKND